MRLDQTYYVPILKWRSGEQGALEGLRIEQKQHLMPLLEIVMPKPNSELSRKDPATIRSELISIYANKKLNELVDEISSAWGSGPAFIDFSLLYTQDLKNMSIQTVLSSAKSNDLNLTPVINLSDSEDYKRLVFQVCSQLDIGACVRISLSDIKDIDVLNAELKAMLTNFNVRTSKVDLLIDLKEACDEQTYQAVFLTSQNLISLAEWRNLIISSGAFPLDLSECKLDEDNLIDRTDWVNWKKQSSRGKVSRLPTYSDYTIRHPIHNESFQFFTPTTSIKYTLDHHWWIMKGEKQKFKHFVANAAVLKDSKRFYGEEFSAGDKYAADKGRYFPEYIKNPKKGGTGGTEQWIRMGINHHLAVVVDQLSSQS